jgi:tetratricopeptide (TPR) repeat protein
LFSGEALAIIGDLFPAGTYETWIDCTLYLPHALKAIAWLEAEGYKDRTPPLFQRIGRYYWEQGRSDEAERLDVEVLALYKEVVGLKHPDTIRAMASLASTWWQQGRSDKAERLEVEVLALYKEAVGLKHPDTISAMANLASTWRQQGRSDEAERLQVEVLALYKEVVGPKHPDTIRAMTNLAVINQQSTCNNREITPQNIVVTSSKYPDSTQLETSRMKPHSRLGAWTSKLVKLGKRKDV